MRNVIISLHHSKLIHAYIITDCLFTICTSALLENKAEHAILFHTSKTSRKTYNHGQSWNIFSLPFCSGTRSCNIATGEKLFMKLLFCILPMGFRFLYIYIHFHIRVNKPLILIVIHIIMICLQLEILNCERAKYTANYIVMSFTVGNIE